MHFGKDWAFRVGVRYGDLRKAAFYCLPLGEYSAYTSYFLLRRQGPTPITNRACIRGRRYNFNSRAQSPIKLGVAFPNPPFPSTVSSFSLFVPLRNGHSKIAASP